MFLSLGGQVQPWPLVPQLTLRGLPNGRKLPNEAVAALIESDEHEARVVHPAKLVSGLPCQLPIELLVQQPVVIWCHDHDRGEEKSALTVGKRKASPPPESRHLELSLI